MSIIKTEYFISTQILQYYNWTLYQSLVSGKFIKHHSFCYMDNILKIYFLKNILQF